jgi:hypothetical protein
MATWRAEEKTLESLQKKLREKQLQVDNLTIRAPSSGTVVARQLKTLTDVYLEPGDEILSIGNERHKELQVAISEDDLDSFKNTIGRPVRIRLPDRHVFQSHLLRINPRGSLKCPHAGFSAANGGPLVVKAKKALEAGEDGDSDQELDLLTPHFAGTIDLTDEQSFRFNAGQIGMVSVRSHREAIGAHVYRTASNWIRKKLRQSHSERSSF